MTSANSPTPYRDELFGPWFATSLFVSEPVHNLVHRMVLEPDGVSFRGRRGPNESGREFLASSDNWFRPTMLKTGPDGALWIADMYRYVIEHPEWIPDDWEKRLDLRAGSEQGRIYRVYPVDKKPRPIPRLDRLDTPGWSPRSTAPAAGSATRPSGCSCTAATRPPSHCFASWSVETKRPQTRVQAIWTLADLGGLDEPSALAGLTDTDAAGARERDRGRRAAPERIVSGGRCRAAPGRRLRAARPLQRRAAPGQLGRPPSRRGPGAAGAARWQRSLDAGRDLELGGAPRADAPGRALGRRRRGRTARGDGRAAAGGGRLACPGGI